MAGERVTRLCADATALPTVELSRRIGSLTTAHIHRDEAGRWRWNPGRSPWQAPHPTDSEVVGRIGAVLFECLAGIPLSGYLPEASDVRSQLRQRRPDLPQSVLDLVARLASARTATATTLDTAAAEIGRGLGVAGVAEPRHRSWRWMTAGAALLTVALAVWLSSAARGQSRIEAHGLTSAETILDDVLVEAGDYWTVRREFITAFDYQREIERLWRSRVASDDSRLGRIGLRKAWSRMARGDFLTAEQILTNMPAAMEHELGASHPYVRAARLTLADVLERRGASDEARVQRERASAVSRLIDPGDTVPKADSSGGPPAPGLLAHVAPIAPELEWFRQAGDGSYFSPLTSTARWLSGEQGWDWHVVATSACDAAVDVGHDARRLQLSVRRAEQGWRVRLTGVRPEIDLRTGDNPGQRVAIGVAGTADGRVRISTPGTPPHVASLDPGSAPPPPYGVTFLSPQRDDGCALVWWEIAR